MSSSPMDCKLCRDYLDDFRRELLPDDLNVAVSQHLDACPECAAELRANEQLGSMLRSMAGALTTDDVNLRELSAAVRDQLEAPTVYHWKPIYAWAVAATFVIAIGSGALLYIQRTESDFTPVKPRIAEAAPAQAYKQAALKQDNNARPSPSTPAQSGHTDSGEESRAQLAASVTDRVSRPLLDEKLKESSATPAAAVMSKSDALADAAPPAAPAPVEVPALASRQVAGSELLPMATASSSANSDLPKDVVKSVAETPAPAMVPSQPMEAGIAEAKAISVPSQSRTDTPPASTERTNDNEQKASTALAEPAMPQSAPAFSADSDNRLAGLSRPAGSPVVLRSEDVSIAANGGKAGQSIMPSRDKAKTRVVAAADHVQSKPTAHRMLYAPKEMATAEIDNAATITGAALTPISTVVQLSTEATGRFVQSARSATAAASLSPGADRERLRGQTTAALALYRSGARNPASPATAEAQLRLAELLYEEPSQRADAATEYHRCLTPELAKYYSDETIQDIKAKLAELETAK